MQGSASFNDNHVTKIYHQYVIVAYESLIKRVNEAIALDSEYIYESKDS